jgi:hypothetical protein
MIDTTEQTTCLACGKPLVQVEGRGHRKKRYCDDRCRQRAHRSKGQGNVTIVTNGDLQQRVVELEQELAAANEMIDKLLSRKKTTTPLKRSYQDRLTRKGEQLDWPALEIRTTIKPGRKNWRVFMLNESNDQLIRAIIAVERLEEHQS